MADTSDKGRCCGRSEGIVTINTAEDAKAVLRACLYGRLEKPTVPTTNTGKRVRGFARDSRRLQVVSGTAIVFAGRRYLDGCNWTKTGTDNGFQTHHQQDRPDMLKRTIRFAYKSLLVTVVSYQVTSYTHPSASSISAPDPKDEPLPSELKLSAARKEGSGEQSGIPDDDDDDDDISIAPIGETASQLNLGTYFHTPRSEHDVEKALDGLDQVTNQTLISGRFTEISTPTTTSQKPTNNLDGSRIIGKLLTLKEMLNPINEQEAGEVKK
ncbi:hypothetical protein JVT61DRAFT_6488 [Boletus reticuloceps]|uniref:Uncharacterized protein n=1 Tax=Boletus reticuloceps TaxID=495285 RepID=A0A8I2YJ88_9AGAM|nr:hypothetical protein JVT61DRAFT_6488 [Boletus reticuloceps]